MLRGDTTEIEKYLAQTLGQIAQQAGEAALAQAQAVVPNAFDYADSLEQVNSKAVAWAEDYAADLITGINQTTSDGVRDLVVQAIEDGSTVDDLADELLTGYGFSDARCEMIARTELAYANVQGNITAWNETGVVESKQWIVAQDEVCDDCNLMADEVVPVDEQFALPDGEMVDGPPAHPNCRCDVAPVLIPNANTEQVPFDEGDDKESLAKGREDQPRDDHGRWTDGDGEEYDATDLLDMGRKMQERLGIGETELDAITMTVYHGTIDAYVSSIRKEGLVARNGRRSGDDASLYEGENGESVFVTTSKRTAIEFANYVAAKRNAMNDFDPHEPVVIEVKLTLREANRMKEDEGFGFSGEEWKFPDRIPPERISRVFRAPERDFPSRWLSMADEVAQTFYFVVMVQAPSEETKAAVARSLDIVLKEWDEDLHPRDEAGRFASGDGGEGAETEPAGPSHVPAGPEDGSAPAEEGRLTIEDEDVPGGGRAKGTFTKDSYKGLSAITGLPPPKDNPMLAGAPHDIVAAYAARQPETLIAGMGWMQDRARAAGDANDKALENAYLHAAMKLDAAAFAVRAAANAGQGEYMGAMDRAQRLIDEAHAAVEYAHHYEQAPLDTPPMMSLSVEDKERMGVRDDYAPYQYQGRGLWQPEGFVGARTYNEGKALYRSYGYRTAGLALLNKIRKDREKMGYGKQGGNPRTQYVLDAYTPILTDPMQTTLDFMNQTGCEMHDLEERFPRIGKVTRGWSMVARRTEFGGGICDPVQTTITIGRAPTMSQERWLNPVFGVSEPLDVVEHSTNGTGVGGTWRHEIGHAFDLEGAGATAANRYDDVWERSLSREGGEWRTRLKSEAEKAGVKWETYMKRHVSNYGSTQFVEGFAEAFSMFTARGYGKEGTPRLPEWMEDYFRRALNSRVKESLRPKVEEGSWES